MTENSFQSIQLFFCDQQKGESGQFIPTHKDEEASTLTTTKDKKLLKNKISAQNSRLKKKKYIQELENKQKILMQEIENTDLQIQKAKHQLNIFLTKNKENDSFNHDEKPTYERLKKLIRVEQHFDEDEANMLIELLINRIGVTGKERRRMVEYYTKRLVNFSIPAIYRYFLQASTEDKGILSNTMQDLYGWDKELYQKLNLDPLRKQKLEKMRSKIKSEKEVWVRQIQDFNLIQSKIYTVSAQVEEQLLTLRYLFNTRQTGQIIIGVENRKYNKEISLFKDPVMSSPVKKVKKE